MTKLEEFFNNNNKKLTPILFEALDTQFQTGSECGILLEHSNNWLTGYAILDSYPLTELQDRLLNKKILLEYSYYIGNLIHEGEDRFLFSIRTLHPEHKYEFITTLNGFFTCLN